MESGTAGAANRNTMVKTGFAAWQEAWQHLGENPMAQYLLLAENRRSNRGKKRRLLSYILLIGVSAALWIMFIIANSIASYRVAFSEIVVWSFSYVCLIYLLWLAECIFNTVRDTLLVLAPPSKLASSLALDDTLAVTSISNEDIVLGVLRIVLPPLWIRGIAGSVLLWIGVLIVATDGLNSWGRDVEKLLVLLPLGITLTVLSSLLGGIAFVLFYLAASQSHNTMTLSGAAVIATIWQMLWILIGPAIAFAEIHAVQEFAGIEQVFALGLGLAGIALCVGLISVAVARARYVPIARVLNAVLGPYLLPGIVVFLCIIWFVSTGSNLDVGNEESFGMFVIGYMHGGGSILPFNAGAIFVSMFTGVMDAGPELYWQLLRIPGYLLLQGIFVAILAWAAKDSVNRRRTLGVQAKG